MVLNFARLFRPLRASDLKIDPAHLPENVTSYTERPIMETNRLRFKTIFPSISEFLALMPQLLRPSSIRTSLFLMGAPLPNLLGSER